MLVQKPDTLRSLEAATESYQKQLENDDEVLTYLTSRKISSSAVNFFRLGVVREPEEGHDQYRNRISFPYVTPNGVVTIRFRTIGDPHDKAKFLTLPGDIPRLYNTQALLGSKEIYICEGEPDTIAGHQSGLPCVGLPGANTWAKTARVFSRIFANRKVTVLAQSDDTGQSMELAQDIYRSLGGCRIVKMPDGMDVSKFVLTYGEKALLEKAS